MFCSLNKGAATNFSMSCKSYTRRQMLGLTDCQHKHNAVGALESETSSELYVLASYTSGTAISAGAQSCEHVSRQKAPMWYVRQE